MILPMSARTRAAVASVALLAVAACSGGHSSSSGATTTSSTTTSVVAATSSSSPSSTSTPTTVSGTCTQADPKVLATLVPQRLVPTGFVMQPEATNQTGPTDFTKAVSDDGEPDASAVLKADGFRRGYQRLWAHADHRKVIAVVYEFCSLSGAKAYATRAERLGTSGTTSPFTVTGIPGAVGITAHDNAGSSTALVQATPGRYVIVASASGPTTVATQAQIEQLATSVAKGLVAELTANV